MKEYSLFWIKPEAYNPLDTRSENDALKKPLLNIKKFINYIKSSLEKEWLEIITEKETTLSSEIAWKHYEEHFWIWCNVFNENKFDFLVNQMTSGKSYWIVFSWKNAIKKWREVLINIRDEFLIDRKKARLNMTHASDSIESANREILLHFPELQTIIN